MFFMKILSRKTALKNNQVLIIFYFTQVGFRLRVRYHFHRTKTNFDSMLILIDMSCFFSFPLYPFVFELFVNLPFTKGHLLIITALLLVYYFFTQVALTEKLMFRVPTLYFYLFIFLSAQKQVNLLRLLADSLGFHSVFLTDQPLLAIRLCFFGRIHF